ncbi:hypothetical protein ZEAMMB73_Zm00001d027986 [Zea mays]|uniref:Uncharacterized protein n=1 Tax=Zea mays TaxID=4577 RepID=A0A1D6JR53_MAIZE|nr:hypothetical protein ZEAMMB73_Zm00001d027986 [Zea mays]
MGYLLSSSRRIALSSSTLSVIFLRRLYPPLRPRWLMAHPKDSEFLNVPIQHYLTMQTIFGSGVATNETLGIPPEVETIDVDVEAGDTTDHKFKPGDGFDHKSKHDERNDNKFKHESSNLGKRKRDDATAL